MKVKRILIQEPSDIIMSEEQDEEIEPVDWSFQSKINQDLKDSDLQGANLRRVILDGSNLQGSNLAGADLRNASLIGTDLMKCLQFSRDFLKLPSHCFSKLVFHYPYCPKLSLLNNPNIF